MLEGEVDHPTNDERSEILVSEQCRRYDLSQDIKRRESVRVSHRWQINERLDRPVSKLRPDVVVLALYFLVRRPRRPVGTSPFEVFETDFDGTVTAVQRRVKGNPQTDDRHDMFCETGPLRQPREAIVSRSHVSSQKFALGQLKF